MKTFKSISNMESIMKIFECISNISMIYYIVVNLYILLFSNHTLFTMISNNVCCVIFSIECIIYYKEHDKIKDFFIYRTLTVLMILLTFYNTINNNIINHTNIGDGGGLLWKIL